MKISHHSESSSGISRASYVRGCRCAACTEANAVYTRDLRRRQRDRREQEQRMRAMAAALAEGDYAEVVRLNTKV